MSDPTFSAAEIILSGLHINQRQVAIYEAISKIEELDDVRVFTSMIPEGTRIPGAAWHCDDKSQLAVRANIPKELYVEDPVRQLLGRYDLGDAIESCFYHPDGKLNGVKLDAGKGRALVDNVPQEITHTVYLHLEPKE